jgi:hypothetical protein
MRTYLAGPMSGLPDFNYPAFNAAAAKLRAAGHFVFNPAEANPPGSTDYRTCMAVDLAWICAHAEAIALLPGWYNSKGATVEKALADALGLKLIFLYELAPVDVSEV